MMSMDCNTLVQALDASAKGAGALTFIDGQDDERSLTYGQLRERALRMLSTLHACGLKDGDYLILFVDDNARFVEFFWAAIYGGIMPVPLAAGAADAHRDKFLRVWCHLGEPLFVTNARHLERLQAHDPAAAPRIETCALSDNQPAGEPARPVPPTPEAPAFVQFSSGSTGDPKGVVLTHANISANLRAITQASHFNSTETALSWMPLTHDMGLIGFHLTLLANGFDNHIMRTDVFARRPLLWLLKAAEKRATLLCSPNFGYRHTLRAVAARGMPDVDLSAVRLLYNGAEPIAPALAREFLDAMAASGLRRDAMFTVYGLAEASLAVTFPPPGRGLETVWVARDALGVGETVRKAQPDAQTAIELARLGQAVPECDVRMTGDDGRALPAGTVGHVEIAGTNVTAGYLDNRAANAAARKDGGWLDTGDLGFMDGEELVITGRAKEIIFVNGQNHYPQDLEDVAQAVAGVDLNKVAAAGVRPAGGDSDQLIFFVLFRGSLGDFVPIARQLAAHVNQHTGLMVDRVLPVRHMPKTTSGKLQRGALARAYANGEFADQAAQLDALLGAPTQAGAGDGSSSNAAAAQIKAICDSVVPDKPLGYDDNLFESGLSSLELLQIHEALDARWPNRLDVTDVFDYPSINDLAAVLSD